ncbi:MAG TPA: hypothetical protein V6C81_18350 [Planktothrix sp.]|jgi:hypothetical protein
MHLNPYPLWECATDLINVMAVFINLRTVSDRLVPARRAVAHDREVCPCCGRPVHEDRLGIGGASRFY